MKPVEFTDRIDPARIVKFELPSIPDDVIAGCQNLGDATGIISDVMDELGIVGVISASLLRPTIEGTRMVGRALTVRNLVQKQHPYEGARNHTNGMAEFEAHNMAEPGDVIVIDGVEGISNMGGLSAQTGKRQGEAGAIVSGGIRDLAHSRQENYPIWASEITPVTGKWRIETIEINGPVQIAGVQVSPGDLVVADDTGVCFIPFERIYEVLELAERRSKKEDEKALAIARGLSVASIARGTT